MILKAWHTELSAHRYTPSFVGRYDMGRKQKDEGIYATKKISKSRADCPTFFVLFHLCRTYNERVCKSFISYY